MPDIAMCQNPTCPMRDKCYRATAKPSRWQSYSSFEWVDVAGEPECENFWTTGVNDGEVADPR